MIDAQQKPIILTICDCYLTTHNFSYQEGNVINSTKTSFTSMDFPNCNNTSLSILVQKISPPTDNYQTLKLNLTL